jgi:hypothetical protein
VRNSTCSKNSAAMRSNAKLQNTLAKMTMPVTGEDALPDTRQRPRLIGAKLMAPVIRPFATLESRLPFATLHKCKACKHEYDDRRDNCPTCGRLRSWRGRSWKRSFPGLPSIRISEVK